jgi:uncharacterized protein
MGMRVDPIKWFFDKILFKHPVPVLLVFFLVLGVLAVNARNFQIEASAETLIDQSDEEYLYFQEIIGRYGFEDFVFITYTPHDGDLFSEDELTRIASLRDDVEALSGVSSVVSLLDVPLLESPPRPLDETIRELRTLKHPGVDIEMAREEFRTSPLYSNLLVSPDLKTTALQINFQADDEYEALWDRRQALRDAETERSLTSDEQRELADLRGRIQTRRNIMDENRHRDIQEIRSSMHAYENQADLFLGGISIIADDLMRFIESDLRVFSGAVLAFLIVALGFIFRRIRWVALPILCCTFSVTAMTGLLGLFGWQVTIVSANFVALQLIFTMAISIHLIVRYRELAAGNPSATNIEITRETVLAMKTPIFYAGLTTMAGFGSLWFSEILPVVTFGWMMSAGIFTSLVVTFSFFPAVSTFFAESPPSARTQGNRFALPEHLSRFTAAHGTLVIIVSAAVFIAGIAGIAQLRVENSFLNYFKTSTDTYQGLKVLDRQLGGTTPLDVVISFNSGGAGAGDEIVSDEGLGEFDDFDEFDEFDQNGRYWFTQHRLERIEAVHDYLDENEFTGKVLSLAVLKKMAERMTGSALDSFQLNLIFNQFPEEYREMLVDPYVSLEHNETRINLRVIDSSEGLRRNEMINQISRDLTEVYGFEADNVNLTGMMVLYNDVLQRLFTSQIMTIGAVLLALLTMFLILFRSLKVAMIALFPNILSTSVVLGMLGWLDIPLDIMTITIASVSIGIAVDNSIHYLYRFKGEFAENGDYVAAMHKCHGSIAYALYYTCITIVAGFAILALSNFIPTIIFGLFSGLAMLIALLGALTLLPRLIILFKPFGPEREPVSGLL